MGDRQGCQGCSVVDLQFLINVVKVNLYGALRYLKPPANLLVRKTVRNQEHDLPLSDCQQLSQDLALRPPFGFTFECCIDHSQGQPHATFGDSPNALNELRERLLFEHDPLCPVGDRTHKLAVAGCRMR